MYFNSSLIQRKGTRSKYKIINNKEVFRRWCVCMRIGRSCMWTQKRVGGFKRYGFHRFYLLQHYSSCECWVKFDEYCYFLFSITFILSFLSIFIFNFWLHLNFYMEKVKTIMKLWFYWKFKRLIVFLYFAIPNPWSFVSYIRIYLDQACINK